MDVTNALPSSLFGTAQPQTPAAPDELGKDTFLRLLTTQLQNQDPSSPMANEEFIAQLATFSNVEQLMGMREVMEAAAMGIAALNNASMATLLGTEVTARADQFVHDGDGEAVLNYDAAASTDSVTVRIYDESGALVFSENIGGVSEGEGTWTWDGTDLAGNDALEGTYTFEFTAADGTNIDEHIIGVVDEMDYTTGTPRPSVGGVPVDIGNILTLQSGLPPLPT